MGDFSRNPNQALAEAVSRHYVGARIQQGVPVLDADLNLSAELVAEHGRSVGRWFIGDGVPSGSDGFAVFPSAQPNDFAIRAGLCLVGGKLVVNDADARYSTQPRFGDPVLVPPLPVLATPAADKPYTVYLDVWEREVDSAEDADITDARIGIETTVRVKREWAVRVAPLPEGQAALDNPAPGHLHYPLARLNRAAGQAAITDPMIKDLRDTQVSVRKRIDLRDSANIVLVDNAGFRLVLENTRNHVQAFVRYIATQFNHADVIPTFAENLGLQAASRIIQVTEGGLSMVDAEAVGNRAALRFLSQLYDAENNFMIQWRDVVLQLGVAVKKYATYASFITRLGDYLNLPVTGTVKGLKPSLQASDLAEAAHTQAVIAALFGSAGADVPRGTLQISLLGVPLGVLTLGQIARFEFRVKSNTTLPDTYTVSLVNPAGWPRSVVDTSGIPIPGGKVNIGALGTEATILVDATVQAGSSPLQIRITSDANPTEVTQLSSLYTLTVGQPPPPAESRIQFQIVSLANAVLDAQGRVVVASGINGFITMRFFNMTDNEGTFALTLTDQNLVGAAWTRDFGAPPPSLTIPAHGSLTKQIKAQPAAASNTLDLVLTATATILGSTVTGSTTIALKKA